MALGKVTWAVSSLYYVNILSPADQSVVTNKIPENKNNVTDTPDKPNSDRISENAFPKV